MSSLSPYTISLIQEAMLASFWYKRSLKNFLRRMGISDGALARLDGETTKREFIDWLLPKLEKTDSGTRRIEKLANELARQTTFPDLGKLEDSKLKIVAAQNAVADLRRELENTKKIEGDLKDQRRLREAADERRKKNIAHSSSLADLQSELDALAVDMGDAAAGYKFQDWFGKLAELFELPYKKSYRSGDREIDGSITIDGMTFLLSLRFRKSQAEPTDISDLRDKVNQVADFTMGIMISMNGFTEGGKRVASQAGTNLLVFDATHLYLVLSGAIGLDELVRRVRRHASRTGQAYLPVNKLGE